MTIDYDNKYRLDYLADFSNLSETDRMMSLTKSVRRWLVGSEIRRVLDYGCGQGRYFPVWRALFPDAKLYGAEISDVAIGLIKKNYSDMDGHVFKIENDEVKGAQKSFFDLVISIEVIEHVENLTAYFESTYSLLRDGGYFLWTTPSANAFSLEWLVGVINGGIQPTDEGFRRYRWEDPAHLRRLKSRETAQILQKVGYKNVRFDFRAHFFCTITYQIWLRLGQKNKLARFLRPMAHLDYILFRNFPNSASMIGIAQK